MTTKKITKATFKSFVKKNLNDLHINVRASFDGMLDGLEWNKNGFKPAIGGADFERHTLGIKGIWLVDSGRDYFSHFEDNQYIGIAVSNCCGYFTVAIEKIREAA